MTERVRPSAVLLLVGGVLLCFGSFLVWAEMSGGGRSVSANGLDGTDGYVTLAAGAIALVVGVAALRRPTRPLAAVGVLVGIVAAGLGIFDALTAKDVILDAAAERLAAFLGATAEQVRPALDQAIAAGDLVISVGVGLYVVIAGGLAATVGGILGIRDAPPVATTPPPASDAAAAVAVRPPDAGPTPPASPAQGSGRDGPA